jgi:hypothetical protein
MGVKQRLERVSGAQGELSPLLRSRVNDLAKAAAADARLENITPLPEGARTRTPGTRFIAPWKDETRPARLIDFEVTLGDSYMLAFNGGVMQVFRNQAPVLNLAGTAPYELAHPFPDNRLDNLFKAQVRGTMFIAGGGRPRVLVRNADNDWTISEYVPTEAPVRLQNTDKTSTIRASAETGVVTLTASKPIFLAGHVGSIWRIDEGDLSTVPAWKAIETPIALGQRRRNKGRIYEVVTLNATTGDTGPNPPVHDEGDVFSSGGNVTWRFISNAGGYVRINAVASATSATATVLDRLPAQVTTATASYRWFEAAWSDVRGWPDAVSVSDQSLVWTRENEYFISKANDLYSFDLLDEEDSAISAAINSPDGKLTEIVWVLPVGIIVLGARSNEWVIRGGNNAYERLTATNQRAVVQGSRGSYKPHQPAMVEGGAVYIGRGGRSLHFAKFDGVTEQIDFQTFTTFSRNMLRAGARQLAWCPDPNPVLWVRMADGTLRGLTLMPEQDVAGWHRRPMINGKVLQNAAVQSSDDSFTELWLGVERVINGQTRRYWEVQQRYFEALDEDAPTAAGAWFVDCALATLPGAGPFSTVSGLGHLEGQLVNLFADGVFLGKATVSGGSVTLPRPMRNIVVGLPLAWRLDTLPFEASTNKGTTKGLDKSTNQIALHLHETGTGFVSANGGPEELIYPTAGVSPAEPLALLSEVRMVTVEVATGKELTISLSGDDALPFTLLSLALEADIKDP